MSVSSSCKFVVVVVVVVDMVYCLFVGGKEYCSG